METGNFLLAALAPEGYGALAPHLAPFQAPMGTVLYEAEGPVDWVYFPQRGLISIISVMISGATAETAIVGREGAVGFVEAAGSGLFLSRAVAVADLRALRVPALRYRESLNGSAALRRAVASNAELNMAESRQALACSAHHQADSRLAWWLLECYERAHSGDRLPLTQDFMASMLGLQRTTVTAVARRLRAERLIDYRRGTIVIKDRAGLEARSCECYATV